MISDIDGMPQPYGCVQQLRVSHRLWQNRPLIASVGKSRAAVWTSERADTLFVGERVRKTADCQRDCASNHNGWEAQMAKSARKRRARRKKSANHGKRPNA
jgi:hypothetical protein